MTRISKAPSGNLPSLSSISTETLAFRLKERFSLEKYDSQIGSRICLSINPQANHASERTQCRTLDLLDWNEKEAAGEHDSHYQLAKTVFRHLDRDKKNQVIHTVGVAGSGKSYHARNMIAVLAAGTAVKKSSLPSEIMAAIDILQALTSAESVDSSEGSQCGFVYRLQYSLRSKLIGMEIVPLSMDFSCVTKAGSGRRNFGIFHYLLNGASPTLLKALSLDPEKRYRYLGRAGQIPQASYRLSNFTTAFDILGISEEHLHGLFQILAAILNIGEVMYVDDPHTETVTISNEAVVQDAANLLGINTLNLIDLLKYRSALVDGDLVTTILNADEARSHADELAEELYSTLVRGLLQLLTDRLSQDATIESNHISILDSSTSHNNARQALEFAAINEWQYRQLALSNFRDPARLHESQGIETKEVEYVDNSLVTKALLKPGTGLLAMIDYFQKKSKSALSFTEAVKKRFAKNDCVTVTSDTIVVRHHDRQVHYNVKELLMKTPDSVLQLVLKASTNPMASWLAKDIPKPLLGLMNRLRPYDLEDEALIEASFFLCMFANERGLPHQFVTKFVMLQLDNFMAKSLCLKIKQMNFPVCFKFEHFVYRYLDDGDGLDDLGRCKRFAANHVKDTIVGKDVLFLTEQQWVQMEAFRAVERQDTEDSITSDEDDNVDGIRKPTGALLQSSSEFERGDLATHGTQDSTHASQRTTRRRIWCNLVRLSTWFIPDFALSKLGGMKRDEVRVAWREKFFINMQIWLSCAMTMFIIIGFAKVICPTQDLYSTKELSAHNIVNNPNDALVAIRGEVFDLTSFIPKHAPNVISAHLLSNFAGQDVTDLFPQQVSALCYGKDGKVNPDIILSQTENMTTTQLTANYHDFRHQKSDRRPDWYWQSMSLMRKGFKRGHMGYTRTEVRYASAAKLNRVIINNEVFDLTLYMNGGAKVIQADGSQAPKTSFSPDFMHPDLMTLIQTRSGHDITKEWDALFARDPLMNLRMGACMRNLFFIGKVDKRSSLRCEAAKYSLLFVTSLLVAVIGFKFIAALQFSSRGFSEKLDKYVLLFLPCYTEDENSLRRSIDSLARMTYSDRQKLLFVVCDGNITGAGNSRPTPRIVLDILNHNEKHVARSYDFESLGAGSKQHNMGKVYSGLYETSGHLIPYIVVVKVGTPSEIVRPGNRGKRDSQVILMRFLNRAHNAAPMNPLEIELFRQFREVVGVDALKYEFLLGIDADTTVASDACTRLVATFVHDNKIIGACGETSLANPKASFMTMIQVYEYYISHNLAKAFESLFSSVTCLPGCFTMYRIKHERTGQPLFVNDDIVNSYAENKVDTLHLKNLLHLGEDRYLTTLLLKYHPKMRTKFIRDAEARTVAPTSWKVLLSQRRRWINSTVHNLFELVSLQELCGCFLFSMRFVVFLDLASTVIQPVTVGYLAYLFYLLASNSGIVPLTSLIVLGAIYGLQVIIFVLRRKWDMIAWMLLYIMAIPIYSFALPLHAFWRMDDFSWGNTRVIAGEKGEVVVADEGTFDPSKIFMQTWDQHLVEVAEFGDLRDDVSVAHTEATRKFAPSEWDVMSQHATSMEVRDGPREAHRYTKTMPIYHNEKEQDSVSDDSSELPSDKRYISDGDIASRIEFLIAGADLENLTVRSVKAKVEEHFGQGLSDRHAFIRQTIMSILEREG